MKLCNSRYAINRFKRPNRYFFSILGMLLLLTASTLYPSQEDPTEISQKKGESLQVSLAVESITGEEISGKKPGTQEDLTPGAVNSFIAFGDSITWGMMRMNNLPFDPSGGYRHPELAYPQKIKEMLAAEYGEGKISYFNLGVPKHTTYDGVERIDEELAANNARYLLIMMGTNDAWYKSFSLDNSLENLAYIIDAALSRNMNVVISTIPPRNDRFNIPRIAANIKALNGGIIDLADEKNINYIDTYTAFMNYDPPDGWKKLMEDRGKNYYINGEAGEHPSPIGHQLIAELFVPQITAYPPATPGKITMPQTESNVVNAGWPENYEFDLSHYHIEFGYFPDRLNRTVSSISPGFIFIPPPFFTSPARVYFRIRAIDDRGNKSGFTPVYTGIFD
jgi:lysophospholipase L1-like esterase